MIFYYMYMYIEFCEKADVAVSEIRCIGIPFIKKVIVRNSIYKKVIVRIKKFLLCIFYKRI